MIASHHGSNLYMFASRRAHLFFSFSDLILAAAIGLWHICIHVDSGAHELHCRRGPCWQAYPCVLDWIVMIALTY